MVPLVSWAAPAHVPEGFLLVPSIYRCRQRFDWVPEIVVGDLGYIEQTRKRHLREKFGIATVTKMKSDMTIKAPFETWNKWFASTVKSWHGLDLITGITNIGLEWNKPSPCVGLAGRAALALASSASPRHIMKRC
jgi:hypothetical protein